MDNSPEYVIQSVSIAKRMIQVGSSKQKVMAYLSERNNTEEVSNGLANLAMKFHAEAETKEEKRNFIIGVVLSLVGAGISFATYQYAQGGGTYVVTYGIIIYGIFISGKSLLELLDIKEKEKKWKHSTSKKER